MTEPVGRLPVFARIVGIVLAGDPQGEYAPLFLCDQCHDYVRHAPRGVLEWDDPTSAAAAPDAYVRHQDCQQHLARWMPLDIFLMQLGWNSGTPAVKVAQLERQGGTRGVW